MALLRGLEPVATIASVAGADAGGLISLILRAALTVRRNKGECRELARRAMMTGDLIRKLGDHTVSGGQGSARWPGAMQRFFMGWKQADQFRQVNKKIDSYLQLFPFLCHIDITGRLERLSGAATCQTQSSQAAKSVSESFPVHSYFDARSEGRANGSESTILMKTQQATDLSEDKEQQREGTNPQIDGPQLSAHPTGKHEVAIKRCFNSGAGLYPKRQMQEYEAEFQLVTKLQHVNIVKLVGYCIQENERILIYEYMSHGSLDAFIFATSKKTSINWSLRFKIIEGIAQGVAYLHKYSGLGIVHRDLKPSNIALDYDMNPKIIDFGTAKVLCTGTDKNEIVGTPGYIDPEYYLLGICSTMSDVYSFGVMLLEIITARRCYPFVDAEHPCDHLVAYAWDLWTTGRTIDLIDPELIYEPRLAEILRCIEIALLCVQVDPLDRPSMPDVVHMLSCGSMALPRPRHAADEDRQERSGGRTVDAERQAVAACLHAKQKLARRPRVAFQLPRVAFQLQ
ncbi:hypothetical protein ACP70R_008590 [Stipagrostis hirtigluma subsp. patula]